MNNTITGISEIRSAKIEKTIYEEYTTQVDYHTRAVASFTYLNRWFCLRLDSIANLFVAIAVFSCIFLKDYLGIRPGQIGIMLVYLFQMLPNFQWCCRQSCEVENLMTSVERILDYAALEHEPIDQGKIKPPADWPQTGDVSFNKVSFKYGSGLPKVLNNLSFEIKSEEKIGIVGRTGAGKSSIIQALFRMAESEGSMIIDGINIRNLSLHDLRKRLSIIPVIF